MPANLRAPVEIAKLDFERLESPLGLGMLGSPAGPLGAGGDEILPVVLEQYGELVFRAIASNHFAAIASTSSSNGRSEPRA